MTAPVQIRLRAAAAALPKEGVSMETLARAHGPDSHATLLLLMSLPCMLPIPGVGTALGVGLLAFAVAIWRGSISAALPPRVARFRLSQHCAQRVLLSLAAAYELAGRLARARAERFARADQQPWFAIVVALLALVIVLPIPFGNVLPAMSMTLIALGVVFRDGVVVLSGLAVGIVAILATAGVLVLASLWGTEWIASVLVA